MANTVVRHGLTMRKCFDVEHRSIAQWFPGHMGKGIVQMQRILKSVDCIIEVHDARIPISGRNPIFESRISSIKPHILILNKMDLIENKQTHSIMRFYEREGIKKIIFTNSKKPDSAGIKSVIPTVSNLIKESERFNRAELSEYQLMVIGVPNVGKSSLINALRAKHLRRSKATAVGGLPGITKSVLERIKVCSNPTVFLRDTPGILSPSIPDVETGLKLALAATIKDHLVGEDNIADYLLYKLNVKGNHSYVDYLGIEEPTDNIQHLLTVAAVRNNWYKRVRTPMGIQAIPDYNRSAVKFIRGFRTGDLGLMILDDLSSIPAS